jgi:hypothetical protein
MTEVEERRRMREKERRRRAFNLSLQVAGRSHTSPTVH